MDIGPITLVYYSMCTAPGAVAGLFVGLTSRLNAGGILATIIIGAIGGVAGGYLIATVPTPPPGTGNDVLMLGLILIVTAFCGGVLAYIAARLLRRSGA